MLTLQHIHQSFDGKPLLQGISLSLRPGETLCLLGASGSGKSTLLRIIAGLQKPESGEVRWEGESLAGIPPHRRGFGLVFQDYALFPHLTVAENVAFGLRMQANRRVSFGRKSPAQAQLTQRVQETLALVHLSGFEKRRVTDLSGGEQQRVALARALAPSPRLLMFDEPLGALDRALKESLLAELRRILRRTQIPAIYVTHDQEEALSLSDRIVVMSQGKMEQVGTPNEIYNFPATEFVAQFVGQINLLPVEIVKPSEGVVRLGQQIIHAGKFDRLNGHQMRLAVRPEELNPGYSEGANNLTGQVESVTYLGSIVRVRVQVEGHPLSMDLFNERKLKFPAVGESFQVTFPVDACWLL